MNKTGIEWVINPDGSPGFSWNPVVGCVNNCHYCYARRVAKRFVKCQQCVDFFPHLHPERLDQPLKRKKPATIFVGSMCDLWDPNVPLAWRQQIWDVVRRTPKHTYLVLTKQPQNISSREKSDMRWSRNLWLGITVTQVDDFWRFGPLRTDRTFVSFEPLLESLRPSGDWRVLYNLIGGPRWVIIGAQTGPDATALEPTWVKEIFEECNGVVKWPIFAKDNLDWPAELGPKPRELPYLNQREVKP